MFPKNHSSILGYMFSEQRLLYTLCFRGINVLNNKSELEKVLAKHRKASETRPVAEKEVENEFHRILTERAKRLEQVLLSFQRKLKLFRYILGFYLLYIFGITFCRVISQTKIITFILISKGVFIFMYLGCFQVKYSSAPPPCF